MPRTNSPSSRSRRPVCLIVVAALAVATAACTTATSASRATTTSTDTAPTSTTSTTSALPTAPQPSASSAANALVAAWASGNKAQALSVATTAAVDSLFAVPYPSGLAIARGCTTAFPPIICTFGPPGGGPTTASIFQLSVTQGPGGWYVSSVQVLTT